METFTEPSKGSFSVPVCGTSPAQSKGTCKNYQAISKDIHQIDDKQEEGRSFQPPTVEILKGIGLNRGSSVLFFGNGKIWKPPDLWECTLQCQSKKKRRGKRGNRRSRKIYATNYGTNRWQGEGSLEPSAPATDENKQRRAETSQEKHNECFDKRVTHHQQEEKEARIRRRSLKEGREAYLQRRSHKEAKKDRKRGPREIDYIRKLQFHILCYLIHNLLPPQKTQPLSTEKYHLCPMDSNRSRAQMEPRGESYLIPSSSRGRGGRPNLSSSGGRGIAMLLGKMLTESKVALAKAAGAARYVITM
ncbi:unnamed protein product [Linum trigynum]|uniref:Uncharacterized protein n=1 Tax=Linum trigynum TaxID=586398 RepID=A0AAV2DC48_9ROSI